MQVCFVNLKNEFSCVKLQASGNFFSNGSETAYLLFPHGNNVFVAVIKSKMTVKKRKQGVSPGEQHLHGREATLV